MACGRGRRKLRAKNAADALSGLKAALVALPGAKGVEEGTSAERSRRAGVSLAHGFLPSLHLHGTESAVRPNFTTPDWKVCFAATHGRPLPEKKESDYIRLRYPVPCFPFFGRGPYRPGGIIRRPVEASATSWAFFQEACRHAWFGHREGRAPSRTMWVRANSGDSVYRFG